MASWAAHEVTPDPRPAKRHKATSIEEKKIRKAFEFACCLTCGTRPIERHHVIPRSQGGDDVIANLVPLCNLHHGILEGHAPGWERVAASVRVYVLTDRARCLYAIGKVGWERFSQRYPLLSEGESLLPGVRFDSELPGPRESGSTRSPSESDWLGPYNLTREDERQDPWDIAYEPQPWLEDR